MFSKIGRLAERMASTMSTSRRGFLGQVGKSALGVAGALGALAVTASAQSGGVVCCKYRCRTLPYKTHHVMKVCQPASTSCAATIYQGLDVCKLKSTTTEPDCSKC
jgi:hypothetical protein